MATKTNAQMLAEAKAAYHDLRTGAAVSRWIDQNGESVQYFKSDLVGLKAYIAELEDLVNGDGVPAYRGPIKFTYGRRGY